MQLLFEQNEQIEPKELKQIYYRIFSSKEGKIILEDLANIIGMYKTNFAQSSVIANTHYTSFLEGHRALFLYICLQIDDKIENIEGKT